MSYSIFVGRDRTADGVGFLAGYGDEPSSHWLEIIPGAVHPAGSMIEVGVTEDADVPGRLTQIPQVRRTARHLRVSYSQYKGHPGPLTNGGLNEHGVAVRDVWSPSRPELVAMTPGDQTGPNYSDLARLVLERARTAREGVELIGSMIAEHGHSSYGGNSHMIADADEGWVVIEFAGGKGLWVAERLDARSLRISRPGYIGEVWESSDFLFSPNFFDFAVSMGWFDPSADAPFDANAVYGDGQGKWVGLRHIETELLRRCGDNGHLSRDDIVWALRTEMITGDCAGYGQIVPLLRNGPSELRILWHAHIGPVAAPFVPVFLGVASIPEEFRQHRYLSASESQRYYRGDVSETKRPAVPQEIEARQSATYAFKRLYYLLMQTDDWAMQRVVAVWEAFEKRLAADAERVRRVGEILLRQGETELTETHLTAFSCSELLTSLHWADELAGGLDIQLRAMTSAQANGPPRSPIQIW